VPTNRSMKRFCALLVIFALIGPLRALGELDGVNCDTHNDQTQDFCEIERQTCQTYFELHKEIPRSFEKKCDPASIGRDHLKPATAFRCFQGVLDLLVLDPARSLYETILAHTKELEELLRNCDLNCKRKLMADVPDTMNMRDTDLANASPLYLLERKNNYLAALERASASRAVQMSPSELRERAKQLTDDQEYTDDQSDRRDAAHAMIDEVLKEATQRLYQYARSRVIKTVNL
jgi:hypothetical protein